MDIIDCRELKIGSLKICDNGLVLIKKLIFWTLPVVLDIFKMYNINNLNFKYLDNLIYNLIQGNQWTTSQKE
jgi:hypothetical protein